MYGGENINQICERLNSHSGWRLEEVFQIKVIISDFFSFDSTRGLLYFDEGY